MRSSGWSVQSASAWNVAVKAVSGGCEAYAGNETRQAFASVPTRLPARG